MRMRTAVRWPRRGHAQLGRSSPRRGAQATALAVVMVAAGVTAGSAAAVSQRASSLRLVYSCAFPSGSQPVSAQITATLPTAGQAGKPIQPTGARIGVTLPHHVVTALTRSKATTLPMTRSKVATLTLTAALGTGYTEGSRSATAAWRNFRSATTGIPRTGPMSLTATGAATPVMGAAAGKVIVTVGDLTLLFTTRMANGRQATPHAMQVTCVPGAGQDTTLAQIAVTGPAPAGAHASPQLTAPKACRPFPKNLKLNPRFPLPVPMKGSNVFHDPEDACTYGTGFTDARKLHEAALVGPGLVDLLFGATVYTRFKHGDVYEQFREPSRFNYHGQPVLPPARATLLGFGFMPVSATLQISEIGTLNADFISCTYPSCPNPKNYALLLGRVTLHISDVDVNGVPLNVGAHCQTATPFNLKLLGLPPAYNVGQQFGLLTGTATVPPFHGCADGTENLDPIFTASVSGPGNFLNVNQGVFCTPQAGCPPVKPKPVH